MCEHIIGLCNDFDDTHLMNLCDLREQITILNKYRIKQEKLKVSDFLDRLENTKCTGCPHCDLDIIIGKQTDALGVSQYSVMLHCPHEDVCNSL